MRKNITMLLFATAAVLTLALATTTASALRSLSVAGGPSVAASGHLTFFAETLRAETSFWCNVTLLRTISRVIPKIERTLIGRITGVAIDYGNGHCGKGVSIEAVNRVIALRNASRETLEGECPETGSGIHLCNVSGSGETLWRLFYKGFKGTLPNVLALLIEIHETQFKTEFRASGINLRCLYTGNNQTEAEVVGGVVSRAHAILTEELTLFKDLLFGCPRKPRLLGTFSFTPSLTITLL